jgi:hypothetical protein
MKLTNMPNPAGRPSKYTPDTIDRLLGALRAGCTYKQACEAAGIGEPALWEWRKEHPDLVERMAEARAVACQQALEAIQTAGKKDWRAHAEWLKMCHPEYRQAGTKIDIAANGQQTNVVCSEQERQQLIAQRERLVSRSKTSPPATGSARSEPIRT